MGGYDGGVLGWVAGCGVVCWGVCGRVGVGWCAGVSVGAGVCVLGGSSEGGGVGGVGWGGGGKSPHYYPVQGVLTK